MNKNEEKLYLDKKGYQIILKEIEELKEKLAKNGKEKKEAFSGAVGDGWHDNFAFDQVNMEERRILGQIRQCYEKLNRAVIIEKESDENLIDLNDIVTINMNESNEFKFKLVGSFSSDGNSNLGIKEITINSPLGKSVYKKQVGEKTSYSVGDRIFNIEILSKVNENEYLEDNKEIKTR